MDPELRVNFNKSPTHFTTQLVPPKKLLSVFVCQNSKCAVLVHDRSHAPSACFDGFPVLVPSVPDRCTLCDQFESRIISKLPRVATRQTGRIGRGCNLLVILPYLL